MNNFKDTCIFLIGEKNDTITFNRNIEITENTFQDTINVGFNLLSPGQKSNIFLIQIDTSRTKALYSSPDYIKRINEDRKPERLTNLLCVYNLSKDQTLLKNTNQRLVIRVQVEE